MSKAIWTRTSMPPVIKPGMVVELDWDRVYLASPNPAKWIHIKSGFAYEVGCETDIKVVWANLEDYFRDKLCEGNCNKTNNSY